ncbi:stage II sporulation protein E [Bacillus carboniphilus]|uniref:Stage II sporulation protein E n=1 Tax=Bacillus carboniphilus TaxID=86663 RepID=A0ABY9JSZ8_9BACI|nr:stage II sporulation protein E [Bacillus carboniphilus]WLR41939.1 stage II sporulation protein E [Bacillus carboniphilus]
MAKYVVLFFAFIGGASIGCTVGIVIGLILSLANVDNLTYMSSLAFSGLLGGLLKEANKFAAGLGLLGGSLLISLYGQGSQDIYSTIIETVIAIAIFLITPKSFYEKLAKHIPGTNEHALEQQQYVRKIRDATANRVNQFSQLFQVLSESFSTFHSNSKQDDNGETDLFLSKVTEQSCQSCFKKQWCWAKNFDTTYDLMSDIMRNKLDETYKNNNNLKRRFENHCTRVSKVEKAIDKEIHFYKANEQYKRQLIESRKVVSQQLLGVSKVMEDFSNEIKKERQQHFLQEDMIMEALTSFGVEINHIEIFSLKKGSVDIEMTVPYCQGTGECEKIIAPMLSDILEENVIVKSEQCASNRDGQCQVAFRSAKNFKVDIGVAHAAKGGGLVSGDSYATIEIGDGKFAVAISDGMGNGERAHIESKETLYLLKELLQSGIDEEIAIKTVNSILSLRTTEEIFSTLDLVIIDLQKANCKFLKIGSSPSFIKRQNHIKGVKASNLPIGIIEDVEVEVVEEELKAGDILIMMSDGIFEGPKYVENHEVWMKRKIRELQTEHPQEVADVIMEDVIRTKNGRIDDDMTVVVVQIEHNNPLWASIPVSSVKKQKIG